MKLCIYSLRSCQLPGGGDVHVTALRHTLNACYMSREEQTRCCDAELLMCSQSPGSGVGSFCKAGRDSHSYVSSAKLPYWHFNITSQITFPVHDVYDLTFKSGVGGDGAGVAGKLLQHLKMRNRWILFPGTSGQISRLCLWRQNRYFKPKHDIFLNRNQEVCVPGPNETMSGMFWLFGRHFAICRVLPHLVQRVFKEHLKCELSLLYTSVVSLLVMRSPAPPEKAVA